MGNVERWGAALACVAMSLSSACGGPVAGVDGGSGEDGSTACASACDDGVFCNGAERCESASCVSGAPPCAAFEVCDEAGARCVDPMECSDGDGDGHTEVACGGDDCDDGDPTRFPGNTEVCDARGHDEDCDATTLGGGDEDSDGHESIACCNAQPDGALSCGDDCDDRRGSVHPGVTDNCNLTDDDCDGVVDEDPATIFYRDLDGDGYGRPGDPDDTSIPEDERAVRACGGGPGFSPFDTDCDDTVRMINPAAPEVCADGIDNNCDAIEDADPTRPGFTCACTVLGEERACGGGTVNDPPAICRTGTQSCQIGGTWSGCIGDVAPQSERCNDVDDDCDGTVDEAVQIRCYADPDNDGFAEAGSIARSLCAIAGRESVGGCPVLFTDIEPIDASTTDCASADATIRPGAIDRCNLLDDDCDGAFDEGASDAGCTDANGWGVCETGQCSLLACRHGRGDCDRIAGNGCESDLLASGAHCGGCGLDCPLGATCAQGVCIDGFVRVDGGQYHVCAIATDASLWCWGANDDGQIGDGATATAAAPSAVSGSLRAVHVAAGWSHTCAATVEGEVYCWGDNLYRQTGQATGSEVLVPALVPGLSGAVEVALGAGHSCARTSAGEVWCWGNDGSGQLGNGSAAGGATPTRTLLPSAAIEITSGNQFACAALDTGAVHCWGTESIGEIGDGGTLGINTRQSPVPIAGISDAISVEASNNQACVIRASGDVWCWGQNEAGVPLGLSTYGHQAAPVHIPGVSGAVELAAGVGVICARQSDGALVCWGSITLDGSASALPRVVTSVGTPTTLGTAQQVLCMVDDRGSVICAGRNDRRQLGTPGGGAGVANVAMPYGAAEVRMGQVPFSSTTDTRLTRARNGSVVLNGVSQAGVSGALQISGTTHYCAALASGQIACWGRGAAGQLGDGRNEFNVTTAVLVSGITDAWQVATGDQHTCALHRDGSVSCWGSNIELRLGASSPSSSNVPVAVPAVTDGVEIVAGTAHTCVRRSDGRVMCWGANGAGQLGTGSTAASALPSVIGSLDRVTTLSADGAHACATLSSGELRCWGANMASQLGNDVVTTSRVPISVVGVSAPIGLASGRDHQCALDRGGRVECWGEGTAAPVLVPSLYGVRQVDGGMSTSCAVQSGAVMCWSGISSAPMDVGL